MQKLVTTLTLTAALVGLTAAHAESAHRADPKVIAIAMNQQAAQIANDAQHMFGMTAAGQLIVRKATEVREIGRYFLHAATCCDHRQTRLYLRELKDLVDEMERLGDGLKRRRLVQPTQQMRFRHQGFEIILGTPDQRSCGGCGCCAHCNRAKHLREMIEELEDTVGDLKRASQRCACCGRSILYESRHVKTKPHHAFPPHPSMNGMQHNPPAATPPTLSPTPSPSHHRGITWSFGGFRITTYPQLTIRAWD